MPSQSPGAFSVDNLRCRVISRSNDPRASSPTPGCSPCSLLPLPFRLLQPLGHRLVLRGVTRPTLCGSVPTVVPDGHIDAAIDEESHRLVILVKTSQLVQDA